MDHAISSSAEPRPPGPHAQFSFGKIGKSRSNKILLIRVGRSVRLRCPLSQEGNRPPVRDRTASPNGTSCTSIALALLNCLTNQPREFGFSRDGCVVVGPLRHQNDYPITFLRESQHRGPDLLGGHSFGTVVVVGEIRRLPSVTAISQIVGGSVSVK